MIFLLTHKETPSKLRIFVKVSVLKCRKTELHKDWKVKNSLIFYSWYHYHNLQGNIPDVMKEKERQSYNR